MLQGAGELFELCDSDELANKLSYLESNTSYYMEMAERCHKRASEYDIYRMVEKYLSVYNNLLKN